MMCRITLNCLLLLLSCTWYGYSQNVKSKDDCVEMLGNSYYSDGQDHQVVILSSRVTRLNVLFLPQFRYRIVICKNTKTPVEMKLKSDEGKILYSNNDAIEWDFQFDAFLKGTVELKLSDKNANDENISLIIGCRPLVNTH